MHASMVTGLSGSFVRMFWAVRLVLASRTVGLLDGGGAVSFGGQAYTGSDSDLGTVAAMAEASDEIAVEEVGWSMTLAGTTDAGIAELVAATYTGRVTVFCGLLDEATGLVIGDPDVRFDGFLEPVAEKRGMQQQSLTVEASSAWAKLLKTNEGQRLNSPFHTQAWAGELGLQYTHGLPTAQAQNGVFIGLERIGTNTFQAVAST